MAIFLTQYDVKLNDGTRKTFAGPDIDCWAVSYTHLTLPTTPYV